MVQIHLCLHFRRVTVIRLIYVPMYNRRSWRSTIIRQYLHALDVSGGSHLPQDFD